MTEYTKKSLGETWSRADRLVELLLEAEREPGIDALELIEMIRSKIEYMKLKESLVRDADTSEQE